MAQGEVATVRCPGEMAAQMATEVGIRAMVVGWAGPTGVTVDEEVIADWAVGVLVGTEAREEAKEVEEVEEGMAGSRTRRKRREAGTKVATAALEVPVARMVAVGSVVAVMGWEGRTE